VDAVASTLLSPELGSTSDLAALVELEEAAFDEPWTQKAIAWELEAAESLVLLLRRANAPGKGLSGWCCLRILGSEGELLRLAVHPRDHRRGHARILLETGLMEVRKQSVERVLLEVREDNIPAITLYRNFGFQPIGRRPRYYRDGTAALIFSLDLGSPQTPISTP